MKKLSFIAVIFAASCSKKDLPVKDEKQTIYFQIESVKKITGEKTYSAQAKVNL